MFHILQVLELPYGKSKMSMVFILPNQIEGLKDLEEKIAEADLRNDILSALSTLNVRITLPKFKIETTIDLTDILTKVLKVLNFDTPFVILMS